MKWKKDQDGDWELEDGGEYVGMICPHHKSYLHIVADGRRLIGADSNAIKANKRWLEKWWTIQKKKQAYENKLWEQKNAPA